MPWGVAAAIGGSVVGGLIQGDAAHSAADTQADATNNATAAQLHMFDQTQNNLQPYNKAGQNALTSLTSFLNGPGSSMYPGFSYNPASDPLYNFMLEQGGKAITNQASALGGVNSGNTLRALSDYGQKTALQSYQTEFSNYNTNYNNWLNTINGIFNRLYNTSSLGENAAANVGNAAIQTGQSIGNNMIGAGNALAAGQIGSANALNGGLQGITGGLQQFFSNPNMWSGSSSAFGPAQGSSSAAPQILYGGGDLPAAVPLA